VFRTGCEPVDAWGAQRDQQKAARVLACRQVRDRVLEAQAQSAARAALRYRQRLLQEAAARPSCALTGSALRQRPRADLVNLDTGATVYENAAPS